MPALFRAYEVRDSRVSAYFIDSTAPNNVDDAPSTPKLPDGLAEIDADDAIEKIATHLSAAHEPNLVVMVHGFNNPESAVLDMYAGAATAIAGDAVISSRHGLVCVGYRWPSEAIGAPLRSSRAALPSLPRWIFWFGVILALCGLVAITAYQSVLPWIAGHLLILVGFAVAGIVLCALLLRIIVYFRDTYRATNYGAPDLIEIMRQIDRRIGEHDAMRHPHREHSAIKKDRDANRVQLSFIGHSMGGYVVTNAIRVLTDLFAQDSLRPTITAGIFNDANTPAVLREKNRWEVSPAIGNVFNLTRFVLVSPDIPAEALLSNRANFLAASLRRFREAYLFSNEGDEVLRQVSTTANYFSFPTKSWQFGFRLGNVEILSSGYGIIPVVRQSLLSTLRVGYCTLHQLYATLREGRAEQNNIHYETVQDILPDVFSYFDCTDYVEPDGQGVKRGVLTFALRNKQANANARMRWTEHAGLLLSYLLWQKPDVHGGYFKGVLSQRLMYRLACLGFDEAVAAFGGLPAMSNECKDKQIRVLLSPVLKAKSVTARGDAELAKPAAQPRQ